MKTWLWSILIGVAVLLSAGGAGYGIGYLDRPDDSGPVVSREQAYSEAREQTEAETNREMERRGFNAGRRLGRNHGIIAGGMAAESAVTIIVRQERAAQAQNRAAEAQAELAGMRAAPPIPSAEAPEEE